MSISGRPALLASILLLAPPMVAQEVGPASGSLVIVGGAMRSVEIRERFVELAGGGDALIVVVPTAGGEEEYGPDYRGLRLWRDVGANNLHVLHTKDRGVADSEAFVAPLRDAGGVWFAGGRQWHIADSYLGTRTEEEFQRVLERGGVIGGTSAGASIQGSYLVRGDTRGNRIMMGDHEEGLGYLKDTAIDQHVLARNRHFDLIELIEARPELLGIGLDEDTAIIVSGDEFEVVGESYVLIYDNHRMIGDDGLFYFLRAGDRYNLFTREAVGPGRRLQSSSGSLSERPWGGREGG